MATWTPDPTFYPSPAMAMQAPPEELAYVAIINSKGDNRPVAIGVVGINAASRTYSKLVRRLDLPNIGDELHHFVWNAC